MASTAAGHEVVALVGRENGGHRDSLGPSVTLDEALPSADLLLICVRDDQVEGVVDSLVGREDLPAVVAHVSGFLPTTILHPLADQGVSVGGFHPLQTLPDAETGARSLKGAHVGIGGDELAHDTLTHLALSLGLGPFDLDDQVRPLYHAAAAASANFVVTALTTAADLFAAARIDASVAMPLVDRVVRNVFERGGRSVLTGPIARGDTETVVGHLVAAHEVSEPVGKQFRLLAEATAVLAGRYSEVEHWK